MKEKLYRIICSSILLIIAVILKNVNNIVSIIYIMIIFTHYGRFCFVRLMSINRKKLR